MTPSRLAALLAAAALCSSPALARAADLPIQDNSFLVEEAYNQEAGVIQHISTFARSRTGAWGYSYTEEWPVLGQTHQASVTFNYAGLESAGPNGLGDVALNYRWQAVGNGETPVAFSPRLTMLLPTGDATRGLGSGGAGLQINLPLSTVLSERFVAHTNIGGTWIPSARASDGGHGQLASFSAGQSFIFLAHKNLNLMAEAVYTSTELAGPGRTERIESLTINPGLRGAINFASGLQVVPGVSVPVGVGPSRGERAIFFYLSFEHPFRLAGPTEEQLAKASAGEHREQELAKASPGEHR